MGKKLYLCSVKAAIKRAKSRMLFELFRAEAGSNEVQTLKRKKIMCKYNITLNDEVVSETRRSFASEAAMDAWLQQQVEALLVAFNARQAAKARARQAIEAMRRQSEQNGNAQLSLDEINNEIRLTRETRKAAL